MSQNSTEVASAGTPVQNLQFRAKISLFVPKTTVELAESSQMKGNGSANLPQKAPKILRICCTLAADSPKPKTDHILGYMVRDFECT